MQPGTRDPRLSAANAAPYRGVREQSLACRAINQPIRVPTLVMRGDSDAFFCEPMYSNLQHWAPGCQLLTVKDCSHWVQQDRCADKLREL